MSDDKPETGYFRDDRHVLYTSWIASLAWKHKLPMTVVKDANGDYHPQMTLIVDGHVITLVVPPPPIEWDFNVVVPD